MRIMLRCFIGIMVRTLFHYTDVRNNKNESWVQWMSKEGDLKKIISKLSKLGVTATVTKSRLEILKVLTPPTRPQV